MAIVEDGVVLAIGLLDLVQRLSDQKGLEAISCHEGQRALEEIEPSQRGELVQHQQDAVPLAVHLKFFGQAPPDLIEDQADTIPTPEFVSSTSQSTRPALVSAARNL